METFTLSELASYYSDYHKDVHGYRPRDFDPTDRVAIMEGIDKVSKHMDWMTSTPAGLAQLRDAGWDV